MDDNMWSLRGPLWVWLLAAVGLSMATDQQDAVNRYIYIPLGGSFAFLPDAIVSGQHPNPTKVTLMKHGPSTQDEVVLEWNRNSAAKEKVLETYNSRTELNKTTGVIIVKNMTKNDTGTYFMVFNDNPQSKKHKIEVINNVPKPTVFLKSCSPPSTTCSLVCEGDITDSGPVAYRWKKDEGEWMSGQNSKQFDIPNDDEVKKVEHFFCEMNNTVSVKQSDSCDNPLYINGNTSMGAGGIVGVIAAVILAAVALVLGVIFRDRIKDKLRSHGQRVKVSTQSDSELGALDAVATTAGTSSPGNGSEDLTTTTTLLSRPTTTTPTTTPTSLSAKTATTAGTSSPGNGSEVPLLEKEESTSADVMILIDCILDKATSLYPLCKEVKANEKQWQRLTERVKELEERVLTIKKNRAGQNSANVEKALRELNITLECATAVAFRYTSDNFYDNLSKDNVHACDLQSLNDRLKDALKMLCPDRQTEYKEAFRQTEDEADRTEDRMELQKQLQLMVDKQNDMADKQDDMLAEQKRLMIVTLQRTKIALQGKTREIRYQDLTFDKMLNKKETSKLYKGEYMKTTVAIKEYTSRGMRKTFEKEIENMEDFVSPYIVRMFGTYSKNETEGPKPTFLIVMEYCDKGSLREVLDKEDNLPWQRKARMCLDAALGLYRLHQQEENPKLHGSINSKTFLVDEDFRVKLGSLELAQTKRSLKKNDTKDFMRYQSPEQLQGEDSEEHQYCKICEMYSLGIVMWEIATRRKPFHDCNTDAEFKERENKEVGPLPEDCPKQLGELITECCAYDISQRPNAGVLVDKLRMVVEQLDK